MEILRIKDFPNYHNSQVIEDYYLLTELVFHEERHISTFRLGFNIIVAIKEGHASITVNNHVIEVENQLFVCYTNAILNDIKISKGTRATLFGFSAEYFFPDNNLYAINHVWNKVGGATTIELTEQRLFLTKNLVEMMKAVFTVFQDNELMREAIHGYIEVVLSAAGQWYIEDTPNRIEESTSAEDALMARFISDKLTFSKREREISFYASRANLSAKYFSELIHKASGRYPSEMIREQVIIEAKGLLGTHRYNIQQVSDKLNFPNSSYFAKYFKSATGVSPKEYMKKGEAFASPDSVEKNR